MYLMRAMQARRLVRDTEVIYIEDDTSRLVANCARAIYIGVNKSQRTCLVKYPKPCSVIKDHHIAKIVGEAKLQLEEQGYHIEINRPEFEKHIQITW